MALIEILQRAILLVWPIESDARQRLSRITALRLLDGQPIHKPNRFEERISSVSTYLGKAHANVADRVCQETTLSKFFTTQPCSPYILVQEESGVLRLDVYNILMQAVSEASAVIWPVMDKPRSDVAFSAAVECLKSQNFSNLTADSQLEAPIYFASAISNMRKNHAAACDAAITTRSKIDFFKGETCRQFVDAVKMPNGTDGLKLNLLGVLTVGCLELSKGPTPHLPHPMQALPQPRKLAPLPSKTLPLPSRPAKQAVPPPPKLKPLPAKQQKPPPKKSAAAPAAVTHSGSMPAAGDPSLRPSPAASNHNRQQPTQLKTDGSTPAHLSASSSKAASEGHCLRASEVKLLWRLLERVTDSAGAPWLQRPAVRSLLLDYDSYCATTDSSTKFGAAGLKSAEDTLVAELAVLMTAGIADEARPEAAKAVSKAGGDNARSKHAPASAIPDSGCTSDSEDGTDAASVRPVMTLDFHPTTCTMTLAPYRPGEQILRKSTPAKGEADSLSDPLSDKELHSLLQCLPPAGRKAILVALHLWPPNQGAHKGRVKEIVVQQDSTVVYMTDGSQLQVTAGMTVANTTASLLAFLQEKHRQVLGHDDPKLRSPEDIFRNSNRAGVPAELHQILAARDFQGDISSLLFRVGRHVTGVALLVMDIIAELADACGRGGGDEHLTQPAGLLIVGPPSCGKSTLLRNITWLLEMRFKKRCVVVDTHGDIAGSGLTPQACIGDSTRLRVGSNAELPNVLEEAARGFSRDPHVVVVDDVTSRADAEGVLRLMKRGIVVVASVPGRSLEDILESPQLSCLVSSSSTAPAPREHRHIQPAGKPISPFSMLVEVVGHGDLLVHMKLPRSVETILDDRAPSVFRRWVDVTGAKYVQRQSGGRHCASIRLPAQNVAGDKRQVHSASESTSQQGLSAYQSQGARPRRGAQGPQGGPSVAHSPGHRKGHPAPANRPRMPRGAIHSNGMSSEAQHHSGFPNTPGRPNYTKQSSTLGRAHSPGQQQIPEQPLPAMRRREVLDLHSPQRPPAAMQPRALMLRSLCSPPRKPAAFDSQKDTPGKQATTASVPASSAASSVSIAATVSSVLSTSSAASTADVVPSRQQSETLASS